jgi:demethoxyubiquinone hydroxylase (CLK1/Coq7/Cat5 family)
MRPSIINSLFHAAAEQAAAFPAGLSASAATGMAVAATTITSAAYQLGRWRERGAVRDQLVLAELSRFRDEQASRYAAIERRLTALEKSVSITVTQNTMKLLADERWRGRTETRIDAHDHQISTLEGGRAEVAA